MFACGEYDIRQTRPVRLPDHMEGGRDRCRGDNADTMNFAGGKV